jgi:transposase
MPGWSTVRVEYKRHEILVHAAPTTELTRCLRKNCGSTNIKANGLTREQSVAHTPLDGRPRRIAYRRQCYYCKDCKKTSLQPVRGIYKGTNMTRRLRRYIARQSLLPDVSFNNLAKEVGRSEKNIRSVFNKHVAHLDNVRKIETPRVMGLDGVYVKRQEALMVTDIERRRTVMMRPSIKERAVAAALREMPDLHKVEEAVSDMAGGLDRVQKEVIPKALRTKDRYHVQRRANAAVDEVRRAVTPGKTGRKTGQRVMCRSHIFRKRKFQLKDHERADLDWCLGLYRELRLTYDLKEVYCEFWNSPDGATARLKYTEWLELHKAWQREMPKDLRKVFAPLIRLMKNWEEGIFNYFHARHTNALTESLNARVKRFTSRAPRANFKTISTKMVHGPRLAQQREAVREKGKGRRGAKHKTPPPTSTSAVNEVLRVSEAQVPQLPANPVPEAERGPRLDLKQIAAHMKRLNEDQDASVPQSAQMPYSNEPRARP